LLLLATTAQAEDVNYGLFVKSFPFSDHEKTSLALENGNPLKLERETTMSFDMFLRKDNAFGVVFRIITDTKRSIDMMFTVANDGYTRYPMLVVDGVAYNLDRKNIVYEKWTEASIALSARTNTITLKYDGDVQSVEFDFSGIKNVRISFGLSPFEGYGKYDIASVNVRNIKISGEDRILRYWKLDSHVENTTFDSVRKAPALTTNPLWIRDLYTSWENIYSGPVKENSLFAFDSITGNIYILSPDSKEITLFNTSDKTATPIHPKRGVMAANAPNQILFDGIRNCLLTYNLDEKTVSRFNLDTETWDNDVAPVKEHSYWNNSASYYHRDSSIVSFGGYGFFKYNNELVRFDLRNNSITKSNVAEIDPRLSAATAIVGDSLYIFGGRGNASGHQELPLQYYYDLYAVNLPTGKIDRLWDNGYMENFSYIPGENMIFDEKENCFYVLTTGHGGTLLKLKKDSPVPTFASYPIYEDLTAHFIYMNLYFSPVQKKLYALINMIMTDKSAQLLIYSLDYPPADVTLDFNADAKGSSNISDFIIWIALAVVLLLLLSGGAYYYFFKVRALTVAASADADSLSASDASDSTSDDSALASDASASTLDASLSTSPLPGSSPQADLMSQSDSMPKSDLTPLPDLPILPDIIVLNPNAVSERGIKNEFLKSSICFLGGFNVTDKDENNVTGLFSRTLKFILVLMLLLTEKEEKGLSGKRINRYLWSGRNDSTAQNSRNVYMNKLRELLRVVGDGEIIYKSSLWKIQLNSIKCDYIEVMRLLMKTQDNEASISEINRLLKLLSGGVLLPNTEADWLDGFKSDFSNLTIDVLTKLSKVMFSNSAHNDIKLKIADILFLHDVVNEEALYLKCSIFFNTGKKGLSKTVYDNFCKEYVSLLGTKYKYSLDDVISGNNREEN
jgi:DNA-binding SARP family transcriptional activator